MNEYLYAAITVFRSPMTWVSPNSLYGLKRVRGREHSFQLLGSLGYIARLGNHRGGPAPGHDWARAFANMLLTTSCRWCGALQHRICGRRIMSCQTHCMGWSNAAWCVISIQKFSSSRENIPRLGTHRGGPAPGHDGLGHLSRNLRISQRVRCSTASNLGCVQ